MSEIKIILSGAGGRLGRAIMVSAAEAGCRIVAGIDIQPFAGEVPVYASVAEVPDMDADCIIDCSHHSAILPLLGFAKERKLPIVICTTGHTEDENAAIHAAASEIPVFHSRNMSVGINLLIELAKKAASVLGEDFDVEIIEQHHNKKLDAPSGTALMIADAISDNIGHTTEYTYERQSKRQVRDRKEIGIHSVRGGTIVGEHEVIFAGTDEVIRISHSAASREVFARGALRAAKYMAVQKADGSVYDMTRLVLGE